MTQPPTAIAATSTRATARELIAIGAVAISTRNLSERGRDRAHRQEHGFQEEERPYFETACKTHLAPPSIVDHDPPYGHRHPHGMTPLLQEEPESSYSRSCQA